VEDRFEFRHDEDKEKRHDAHCHRHHNDRVNHRRHDLVLNLVGFLLKFRKPVEHQLQHAANLARFDHVDVQVVKDPRMQRQRVRKRVTALNGVSKFVNGLFQYLVAFLFRQNGQAS
jgi:hypothetical protein